jgi:hypothetical protein
MGRPRRRVVVLALRATASSRGRWPALPLGRGSSWVQVLNIPPETGVISIGCKAPVGRIRRLRAYIRGFGGQIGFFRRRSSAGSLEDNASHSRAKRDLHPIQFDNSGYLSRAGLENLTKEGKTAFLQMLDEDKIRSVLACAKKSLDIPRRNLALIDRTLRAKLTQRKTTAEKKTPTPTSLPSTASKEVLAVRAQLNQRCTNCRTEFVVLLGIAEADLVSIFLGSKPPPASFLGDAEVGFALMTCAVCAP